MSADTIILTIEDVYLSSKLSIDCDGKVATLSYSKVWVWDVEFNSLLIYSDKSPSSLVLPSNSTLMFVILAVGGGKIVNWKSDRVTPGVLATSLLSLRVILYSSICGIRYSDVL